MKDANDIIGVEGKSLKEILEFLKDRGFGRIAEAVEKAHSEEVKYLKGYNDALVNLNELSERVIKSQGGLIDDMEKYIRKTDPNSSDEKKVEFMLACAAVFKSLRRGDDEEE